MRAVTAGCDSPICLPSSVFVMRAVRPMKSPVLVVPGIGSSGPLHGQSRWQVPHPAWRRLQVPDWDAVACEDWIAAIETERPAREDETLIVAHSLGCLTVAHWGARYGRRIRGALRVAVPDPAAPAFPRAAATGFAPLSSKRLPFPVTIVASSDDPYGGLDHARRCAAAWGAQLVDLGPRGHLNAQSGLEDWPEGLRLLARVADGGAGMDRGS